MNKPMIRDVFEDQIPQKLAARPQWVAWELVKRGREWAESPVCPITGRTADVRDPSTWATLEDALDYPGDGVGFVFTEDDPYAAIHLKDCLDPDLEMIEPWGLGFLEDLNSYAELAATGNDITILVEAELPAELGPWRMRVDVRSRGRFSPLTGIHLEGLPRTPRRCKAALEWLYASQAVVPMRGGGASRGRARASESFPADWWSPGGLFNNRDHLLMAWEHALWDPFPMGRARSRLDRELASIARHLDRWRFPEAFHFSHVTLADLLDSTPSKVHAALRRLERSGILKCVDESHGFAYGDLELYVFLGKVPHQEATN